MPTEITFSDLLEQPRTTWGAPTESYKTQQGEIKTLTEAGQESLFTELNKIVSKQFEKAKITTKEEMEYIRNNEEPKDIEYYCNKYGVKTLATEEDVEKLSEWHRKRKFIEKERTLAFAIMKLAAADTKLIGDKKLLEKITGAGSLEEFQETMLKMIETEKSTQKARELERKQAIKEKIRAHDSLLEENERLRQEIQVLQDAERLRRDAEQLREENNWLKSVWGLFAKPFPSCCQATASIVAQDKQEEIRI